MSTFEKLPTIRDYLYTPSLQDAVHLVAKNAGCRLTIRCAECMWSNYGGDLAFCIPSEFQYLLENLGIV